VDFLLENPPCKEAQPPDILLKTALRAEKSTKIRVFSPRSGVSAACLKGRIHFSGFFMLQILASFQVRQAARSNFFRHLLYLVQTKPSHSRRSPEIEQAQHKEDAAPQGLGIFGKIAPRGSESPSADWFD